MTEEEKEEIMGKINKFERKIKEWKVEKEKEGREG